MVVVLVVVVVVVMKVVFGVVGLIFCCVILRHVIALKGGLLSGTWSMCTCKSCGVV